MGVGLETSKDACDSSPRGSSVCEVPEWALLLPLEVAETVDSIDVPVLRKSDKSRRCLGEDAPFEELDKGELRGGNSERDIARDITVAGAMCMTEIFMQLKWDRAPKGVFW